MYIYVTAIKEEEAEAMNLRESKESYMVGIGERKEKGGNDEMMS